MKTAFSSGNAMPVTGQGLVRNVAAGASSVRTTTGISKNVDAVLMVADEDTWFLKGDSSVVVTATTGTKLIAKSYFYLLVKPDDFISFLQVDTAGNVNITESE